MSGGKFYYRQSHISEIADSIEQELLGAGRERILDRYEKEMAEMNQNYFDIYDRYNPTYTPEEGELMKRAVYILRQAYIYAERVDYFLSGDDGSDSFARRLKEELDELDAQHPNGKFDFDPDKVYFDEEENRYCLRDEDDNEQ